MNTIMGHVIPVFALLFVGSCTLVMGKPSGDGNEIAIFPLTQWKIVSQPGDEVALKDVDQTLGIDYKVDVKKEWRVVHRTYREARFTVELNEPVPLIPDHQRILFEARGQDGSTEARTGTIFIRPLIEDESGERFSYESYLEAQLKMDSGNQWARWSTRPFLTTNAGGAIPGIYDAAGGDQNARPDGKLRFVGFEVRIRNDHAGTKAGGRSGEIRIGGISTAGMRTEDSEPCAYADSLLNKKGDYRLAFEVRSAFQSTPVIEGEQKIAFDPGDERSRRQLIVMPVGSLRNSWINYRLEDEDGAIVNEGAVRWDKDLAADKQQIASPVDVTKPPVIGRIRINPDRAGGVYKADEPLDVRVRVFDTGKKSEGPLTLRWALTPYAFDTKLQEKEQAISFDGNPFVDLLIQPDKQEGRDALRLNYMIVGPDEKVLDRGEYILGIKYEAIHPRATRQGLAPRREDIKRFPYFRFTFQHGDMNSQVESEEEMLKRFRSMLEESKQVTSHVTYLVELSQFEVLPGVFDFSLLDKVMDTASDLGMTVTIRAAHAEQFFPYRWLPHTSPRSFDGRKIPGHPVYGAFCASDPEYIDSWLRGFRALHARYDLHPAFEGYYVLMPIGELVIADEIWYGYIADYSQASVEAFRHYLRETLGLSLEEVNKRWRANLKSWDQVEAPAPDFQSGAKPDLRLQWMDFCRFKTWVSDSWTTMISKNIRTYDPSRIIMAYGRWFDVAFNAELAKVADYVHNGGNHLLQGEGLLADAWDNKGLGLISEPHGPHGWGFYGDPAERGWVLDWTVFVMMSQGGGGTANLHCYYYPNPGYSLAAHYGSAYAYDRYEKYKPILRELHGAKIVQTQKQVAVIQDVDTLFAKHRTTYQPTLGDLRQWFELLKQDSIDHEFYVPEHENQYKMIVLNPLDEVSSQKTIDAVNRMVRNGATIVLGARTGRYCSETPDKEYPLLKAMGIQPPSGEFETNRENIVASVDSNSPIFGGLKAIPFYSKADMRRELEDPKIGADFFNWPYRWLPLTDYFGFYSKNINVNGEALAHFPDGGVALSRHHVGKGQALVFWGTPDVKPESSKGLMADLAKVAGVVDPRAGSAIPHVLEAANPDLKRNYALLYQETPGSYVQQLPNTPDGKWFLDDMVSDQRLGTFTGSELREGLKVTFLPDAPPLKVIRMFPLDQMNRATWTNKYRTPGGE